MGSLKDLILSRTTQNVAAGSVSWMVVAGLVIVSLRQSAPWLLPWTEDYDVAVAGAVGSIVIPWLSRQIAFIRNPDKKEV